MKNQIAFRIKKEFLMTADEISFLRSLPDNLPETKLTAKQKDIIGSMYHRLIPANQVYRGWGQDLAEFEQKEKWPSSGARVKRHEAQRFILGWLAYENEAKKELTADQAAKHFFANLQTREANQILISKIFEQVETVSPV